MKRAIHIGGGSGGFGDSAIAVPQLMLSDNLDYIIFDYLAEGSMSIVANMRSADPASGFFRQFADIHIGPYLAQLSARGVKLVTNAGGVNPRGLAALLSERCRILGLNLKIAAVEGDDLLDRAGQFRADETLDMFTGKPLPDKPITSINAYLGAFPVARALACGADIVVTGRVVDSALVLGPLIKEFGWNAEDYDLLAGGTAAGHILECGTQATGGTFTDWRDVPDWENTGFPIGECYADGSFVVTKPPRTGGLVSVATIAEQLLYEVGDPQCYIVPDVVCDFASAELNQVGDDRVLVTGVRGYPPTSQYKVCATYDDGWRTVALQTIIGIDAAAKAQRQADAILKRTATMLRERNLAPWRSTHVELIGNEGSYGSRARALNNREIISKIVVDHDEPSAGSIFWREQSAAIMNMSVGTAPGLATALPHAIPLSGLFLFLIDKKTIEIKIYMEREEVSVNVCLTGGFEENLIHRPMPPAAPTVMRAMRAVSLIELAWARSGDKGNLFNVGVIARRHDFLPYIYAALTTEAVAKWYTHFFEDPLRPRIQRFFIPGFDAINLVVHDAQGGGINCSARLDIAAKSMAQQILEFPVEVPSSMADEILENSTCRNERDEIS